MEFGEHAFQTSQKLGYKSESLDALLLKAHVIYLGKTEQAFDFITEAEDLFKSVNSSLFSSSFQKHVDILLINS